MIGKLGSSIFFILLYLSFIHEKANYIGVFLDRTSELAFIFEVSGPPVFLIKAGRPAKHLAQGHNKQACRLVLHNLP